MSKSPGPEISIVIPAYNEEKRLPKSLLKIEQFFQGRTDYEVIVVIEKSKDQSVESCKKAVGSNPNFQIIANEVHRGKGFAVKTGMLLARGSFVFFMDADLSTPLDEINSFLFLFKRSNFEIIIGSRAEAQSKIIQKQGLLRQNIGRVFNFLVQGIGVHGFKDTQCGFKAFRNWTVEPIFSRQTIDGFAFDIEILIIAELLGANVHSQAIKWINSADSKVNIFIAPFEMLRDLFIIRQRVKKTLLENPFINFRKEIKKII